MLVRRMMGKHYPRVTWRIWIKRKRRIGKFDELDEKSYGKYHRMVWRGTWVVVIHGICNLEWITFDQFCETLKVCFIAYFL
jgi:hypothetical protein